MPVKAVPVEVEEEPPKEAEVQDAEPAKEESKAEEVEKKRKPRRSKEEMIEEKARKEKAKAAKDAEKIEMKARVQCPICKAKMSQWNLLYKHTCSKEKLEKKPKAPTLEEKFPELDEDEGKKKEEKDDEPPSVSNIEPLPEKKVRRKKVVEIIESESDSEPPSPPPLERHPPRMSYREILMNRQYEQQKQRARREVSVIRNFYGISR